MSAQWYNQIKTVEPDATDIALDEIGEAFQSHYSSENPDYDPEEDLRSDLDPEQEQGWGHDDYSFRLPIRFGDDISCLGRALIAGAYSESVLNETPDVAIYYDENQGVNGTEMRMPHVNAIVDGEEFGKNPNNYRERNFTREERSAEALPDLYKLGLGVKMLGESGMTEEDTEDVKGVDLDDLEKWGSDIMDDWEGESRYLRNVGESMRDHAWEENNGIMIS